MNKTAFTIIEVMIVIILIAAMTAIAFLSVGPGTESEASLLTPSHELYKNK